MNKIQTLGDIFDELDAEAEAEHARFLADPIAQERIRREVDLRAAAAAAEPDEVEPGDEDEDEDEDYEDEDSDDDDSLDD